MPVGAYIADAALWVLVMFQGVVILGLIKKVYERQVSGVDSSVVGDGVIAPDFSALDITGRQIESKDYAGTVRILLFVTLTCSACFDALDRLTYLKRKDEGTVLVFCKASPEECQILVTDHEVDVPIIADENEKIGALYQLSSAPMAVLIGKDDEIQAIGNPQKWEGEERALGGGSQEHTDLNAHDTSLSVPENVELLNRRHD